MATNAKNDLSPPPRPPAPKTSHHRGKQSLTTMAVSFKSLDSDSDDNDYLSVFSSNTASGPGPSESVDPFSKPNVCVTMGPQRNVKSPIKNSKSMDETVFNRNITAKTKPEKRNLLSEIKGKLSDKFPDTYNAIAKRLEEFTNDSAANISTTPVSNSVSSDKMQDSCLTELESSAVPEGTAPYTPEETMSRAAENASSGDKVAVGLQKSSLNDGSPSHEMKQHISKSISPVDTTFSEAVYDPLKNIPDDVDDDDDVDDEGLVHVKKAIKPNSLAIIDDFFPTEAVESPLYSQGSRKRFVATAATSKTSTSSAPNPVTMSSLLSSVHSKDNVITEEKTCEPRRDSETPSLDNTIIADNVQKQVLPTTERAIPPETTPADNLNHDIFSTFKPMRTHMIYAVLVLFIYFMMPLPMFLHGLIVGVTVTSALFFIKGWLNKPREVVSPLKILALDELPPMLSPDMKEPVNEDGKYKGWMNEVDKYSETDYHINQTMSVFVRLEGTSMRLSRPDINIARRAMWDEVQLHPKFVQQRHCDLQGSQVYLTPPGLIKKRVWSKKYPICIKLTRRTSVESIDPNGMYRPEDTQSSSRRSDNTLYLFARTGREKEMWYHRFDAACRGQPLKNHLREICKILEFKPRQPQTKFTRNVSDYLQSKPNREANDSPVSTPVEDSDSVEETFEQAKDIDMQAYAQYMARLMPSSGGQVSPANTPRSPFVVSKHSHKEGKELKYQSSITCEPQLMWLNALIGRCFWEFLWTNFWASKVMNKIQKKISKIRVPYFIEELQITDIFLGTEMPVIRRAGKPYLDEDGFWVNLDIMYNGGFCMAVETKVNLLKLKKVHERNKELVSVKSNDNRASINSDEEDSAESSTDEEDEGTPTADEQQMGGGGKSRKIIRYIDKIAKSKYFQQATEYKYIKKAMEGVSNTRMILNVEVKSLVGTLAVNIPPPPTDRLWYGFRGNPQLSLLAKPQVGSHTLNVSQISEWIEGKLAVEFQRVFVMPNMDDVIIPLLLPGFRDATSPPQSSPQHDDGS